MRCGNNSVSKVGAYALVDRRVKVVRAHVECCAATVRPCWVQSHAVIFAGVLCALNERTFVTMCAVARSCMRRVDLLMCVGRFVKVCVVHLGMAGSVHL